jgi:hypothetical protein
MSSVAESHAISYGFDDSNMNWQTLGDFKGFVFSVYDVDEVNDTVELILKFEPGEPIFFHRHNALTNTLVIEGTHYIYEKDGKELREARQVGSYTISPVGGEPHREGGGDAPCVVYYSVRGERGVLFEVLDDDENIVGELSFQDFKDALAEQQKS